MILPYQPKDKPAVLNLLMLNAPKYFHPDEKEEFSQYLEREVEDYYVYESNGEILGAGGINFGFNQGTTARISWDLVHPGHQRQGVGSALLHTRLEQIRQQPSIKILEVRTTQLVYSFYQKFGFKLVQRKKNFWAHGFDLYHMKLIL